MCCIDRLNPPSVPDFAAGRENYSGPAVGVEITLTSDGCNRSFAGCIHSGVNLLIGAQPQRLRNRETERFGSLEVDTQLELGGLLDG